MLLRYTNGIIHTHTRAGRQAAYTQGSEGQVVARAMAITPVGKVLLKRGHVVVYGTWHDTMHKSAHTLFT